MGKTALKWLPSVTWMALIFYLSSIPKLEVTSEPLWNFITRKSAHMFEYCVLFLLLNRALDKENPLLALVLTVFYAVSDEVHQIFVPLREGAPTDVLIDSIGGALGWLTARETGELHEDDED